MDLRNYGVIDFAEHVVLPTGDADDLDDLDALTHENIVGGLNPFRKGAKQTIIDDLRKTNAELSQKLLDMEAERKRNHKLFTHKYSELAQTAKDRDKKEKENRDLKAQIKSLKAFNLELFQIKQKQGQKKNKMINILDGKTSIKSQEEIERNNLYAYNAWYKRVSDDIYKKKTSQGDRMELYHKEYKKVMLGYMKDLQIVTDMQAELRELANT